MAYKYEELKHKTVAELREIAANINHEALKGHTQLNKEHLLTALCQALGIDMHAHHEVMGVNKTKLKVQIKELKKKRDEALADHEHAQLKMVRRRIHRLRHLIHKAAV